MGVVITSPGGVYTAGEGIDISAANEISGEDATTANKGIASFNTNDFSVAVGAVSLKNKTSYWSVDGNQFIAVDSGTAQDTTNVFRGFYASGEDGIEAGATGTYFLKDVHLPQGAVVTNVIAWGNAGASAESWHLIRQQDGGIAAQNLMASANINTADTTISNATIDNANFHYWIETTAVDDGDILYGVRITYTTDYD